jgi:hypothetical protein
MFCVWSTSCRVSIQLQCHVRIQDSMRQVSFRRLLYILNGLHMLVFVLFYKYSTCTGTVPVPFHKRGSQGAVESCTINAG